MRKLTLIAVTALSLTACQHETLADATTPFEMQSASAEYLTASSLPVTTVSGAITSSTTWSGVIELDGIVTVKNGAVLTIQPGTFIKAKPSATNTATGVLVISRGSRLDAQGTSSQPIVFTSYKLLDGDESTTAAPGDFGGVIILGAAPTNKPTTTVIEGLSGVDYQYGGSNASDNSGTLKYARIEFAGYDLFAPNSGNEINGLTLGGVGSGTTLDHIQVAYGRDDSFEFFGGTVNASNLISFASDDDNFDFDFGYTGTIDCALALADQNSTHSLSGSNPDSNGIELDNDGTGSSASPFTHPVINNLTIVGAGTSSFGALYENAIHVRRNGKLTLNNATVTGYPVGVLLETVSGAPVNLSDLSFTNVQAYGYTFNYASLVGSTRSALTVPGGTATTLNGGMPQPFFNAGTVDLGSRNCGNFFSSWTKYDFSIVE
ncbi:hypothetical protein [Chryseobacterium profundimaris]|uniref:T9SS C-terminal target domain-containing protein n=1 Tax=Chryseobacterium profundimaris TaxID=1387275 RepID=A0ABY1NPS0_9FLAO|nr:hypothetical protein [Chryseobacterium profundimaris]SMP15009.1 hypothetical protein SAMN06264346_103103 [Chryseobacterium profundimaris]